MKKIKEIIDVSTTIEEGIVTWPGDIIPKINLDEGSRISKGDLCNVLSVHMNMHCGTHVDAPRHYSDDGKSVEQLELDRFIGECKVFDLSKWDVITRQALEELEIEENDIILFKTKNSEYLKLKGFIEDFVYVNLGAAQYLVDKNVKSVGIDYLSIGGFKRDTNGQAVHQALLNNEVGIIEGLNLSHVKEGKYFLSCLPLKLKNGDGSLVRAVLIP